jgi:anaphase-promoting complex subunit 8
LQQHSSSSSPFGGDGGLTTPMVLSSSLGHHSNNNNSHGKSFPISPIVAPQQQQQSNNNTRVQIDVEDIVLLAKAYFDMKEYQRCSHLLLGCTSAHARFLDGYARYLAGEKRKEEEQLETADQLQRAQVTNTELKYLSQQFGKLYTEHVQSIKTNGAPVLDGHCLYLYGIVLRELDRKADARAVLVHSVNAYPWNWSAWQTLTSLVEDRAMCAALPLRDHWMRQFFLADVLLELHEHEDDEVLDLFDSLADQFRHSTHVLAQTAMVRYNKREFDAAEQLFEALRDADPYRLESMDTFSNILYVKESKGALSFLAHTAVRIDKYRPETCCIVGNYYSLKAQHEKAVLYFRRALKLNPNYLSAWTLMGHEYVEMRNTSAAIEAYRRAVDINPREYRAWYGLGQTYEILQMHTYSLYYFRKATNLRPYDPRMWCAMADAYERLHRIEDAIKCYLRAEGNRDQMGIALSKLAKLYAQRGDKAKAAHYFSKVLARRRAQLNASSTHDGTGGGGGGALSASMDSSTMSMASASSSATTSGGSGGNALVADSVDMLDALLYLAEYCKNQKQYAKAEEHCRLLLDIGGQAKERAKNIMLEIRQLTSGSNGGQT